MRAWAADGSTSGLSATITVPACVGPSLPPDVTFTFAKTVSTQTAAIGDVVSYTYCGRNTSDIPLEVVRLVDDRLGVVIALPNVDTVVPPGKTVCNTDLGLPIDYTVAASDLGSTIVNEAVVTVHTQEQPPREFQAAAVAEVRVPMPAAAFAPLNGSDHRVTICHAAGNTDPTNYVSIEVDDSAVEDGSGHNRDDHQGGRDIIPPGSWDADGRNWDSGGEAIWANDCERPIAIPAKPTVTQATCTNGVVTAPTVTMAPAAGIEYSASPPPPYNGTVDTPVTVTATLKPGFDWGQIPNGWTKSGLAYTYSIVLTAASCTAPAPVAPAVTQAECAKGVLSPPTLTLPITDGISYTASPAPSPGGTTIVLATLTTAGGSWPATLPAGWIRQSNTSATYTVTFDRVTCTPVQPIAPTVTQATCANGAVTEPTVTTPTEPAGVEYFTVPSGPYDGTKETKVTVTAILFGSHHWGQIPDGWQRVNATQAKFVVTLVAASCAQVTPAIPTVTQAVCVGGVVSAPSLVLEKTEGIEYSVVPASGFTPGSTATVTARLKATGVSWPATLPTGWTRVDGTTATFAVVFDKVECTPVQPVDPIVTQATCTAGVVTVPVIALRVTTGVVYVANPGGPYDGTKTTEVVVTATVADGFAWGQETSSWVQVNARTATFAVTLVAASCTQVTPAPPAVTQAVCANGVVSPPSLVLATSDKITYSVDPLNGFRPGSTATVTATLNAAGVGWPAQLPTGWTKVDNTTATHTVTFRDVKCTPVVPVAPAVTQATCANGVVTPPTIVLAQTTGVSYVPEPSGPYVGSKPTIVRILATLGEGFEWGQLPEGWAPVDATSAAFLVTLNASSCTQVDPVVPSVTQAVCAAGVVSAPSLTLGVTDGITYTVQPASGYTSGSTATVTATLKATGVAWPANLPTGWTRQSDTIATFNVAFDTVTCVPVRPVAPTVTQATCTNGAVTAPLITLPVTSGVAYTLDPNGPYDGAKNTDVVVTASIDDGFEWGPMGTGWVRVDATTATFAVTLAGTSCSEVRPVAPAVTQAVCAAGVVTAPLLVLPVTDGIVYSVEPSNGFTAGGTATVTATLNPAGVGWPATLPTGWTKQTDTTATYPVTFDDVTCSLVAPEAIVVVQAACIDGVVVAPSIGLPQTVGLKYSIGQEVGFDPAVSTGVVITATAFDGFALSETLPAGWTRVNNTTAMYEVAVDAVECVASEALAPPAGSGSDSATGSGSGSGSGSGTGSGSGSGSETGGSGSGTSGGSFPSTGARSTWPLLAIALLMGVFGLLLIAIGHRRGVDAPGPSQMTRL